MSKKSNGGNGRGADDRVFLGFGNLHASTGDHIGHFYETKEDCENVQTAFLKVGLESGQKCVCLSPDGERRGLQEALTANGIDVEGALASGQLVLDAGKSRPQELKDMLRTAMEDVPRRFPILRWVGEMTWTLKKLPTTEKLMEWETHCNCVADPAPVFLCQYDLSAFRGNVVMDALKTHPICIVSSAIHQNPYYQKPEVFLEELRHRNPTPLAP